MTPIDLWLKHATCRLSAASIAQVRTEIQEHYEAALETAMLSGAAPEEAARQAVASLGDAKTANRQYRQVLLTSAEARFLRQSKWERQAVCARPWLVWTMRAVPAALLGVAAGVFTAGDSPIARQLLAAGVMMSLLLAAPTLRPFRGRLFRYVRWTGLLASTWLAFGPELLEYSWLVASCAWPIAWIEWTQASIRRKVNHSR